MKKNLRKTLAVLLALLMLVGTIPMNVFAATGNTNFYQETKDEYEYEVTVTTLNDADDWRAATVKLITSDGTVFKDIDIQSAIDHNGGKVRIYSEHEEYLKSVIFYYKIGFGNREWSGNVVIKANDVVIYNDTQKVTSDVFSVGEKTYEINFPKTAPKTVIFYSKDENGNKSADLTFKQPLDAEEGQLTVPIYTEAQSQFYMAWNNWTDKTTGGVDCTTIVSTSDPSTDTATLGDYSDGGITINLKSTSGIDHTGHYTLNWDTKTSGVSVYEHPFDVDFLFWHKVNQIITENGTVTLSTDKAYTGDNVTVTPVPDDGYVLTSLSVIDADGNDVLLIGNEFTMPNSKVNVKATFAPADYTATFVADGKTVAMIPYNVETTSIIEPAVPEKAGYSGEWESYTLVNGGVTVNAVYTPITYTAKFVADGNTVAEIPYTVETDSITEPDVPEKAGYTGSWSAYTLTIGGVIVEAQYEREFHDFRVTSSTPATCTEEGYDTYTCTICGATYNKTTAPAKAHQFVAVDYKEPTCTEVGYVTYKCLNCDETFNGDYCSSKGHRYVADVVAPTCTEEGYTYYICEDCGETRNNADGSLYRGNITKPVAHVFNTISTVAPTCSEDGKRISECVNCGYVQEEVIPATGHNYQVTSSTPATCTTEGYDTYTCEVCGKSYNVTTTPAIGHNYKVTSSTPATCTDEGYDTYTCTICGESYNITTTSAKGHNYKVTSLTPATCTTEGYNTYTCTLCGETYNKTTTPAKLHQFVAVDYKKPTCGEDGKRISECVNCGYVQEEVIPATGDHKYTAFIVTEPTCAETGVMAYMCANCDALYYEELPATGDHNYDGSIHVEDADNYIVNPSHECTECGHQEAVVLNGWFKHPENGRWMFLENNAKRRGWLHIPTPFDQWYYLGTDGYMVTGLNEINGKQYYFNGYGVMQNGWKKVDNNWYYLDEQSGAAKTGWQQLDETWYYFDNDGTMVTDWKYINNKWYYFNTSGAMQTGWQKVDGKWYYLDPVNGDMKTGWQKIDNKWYYLNGNGAMQTGWKKVNSKWYYFSGSGAMQTGWKKVDGKWYYLESSGKMRTESLSYKGKGYNFSKSGVCLNP